MKWKLIEQYIEYKKDGSLGQKKKLKRKKKAEIGKSLANQTKRESRSELIKLAMKRGCYNSFIPMKSKGLLRLL